MMLTQAQIELLGEVEDALARQTAVIARLEEVMTDPLVNDLTYVRRTLCNVIDHFDNVRNDK